MQRNTLLQALLLLPTLCGAASHYSNSNHQAYVCPLSNLYYKVRINFDNCAEEPGRQYFIQMDQNVMGCVRKVTSQDGYVEVSLPVNYNATVGLQTSQYRVGRLVTVFTDGRDPDVRGDNPAALATVEPCRASFNDNNRYCPYLLYGASLSSSGESVDNKFEGRLTSVHHSKGGDRHDKDDDKDEDEDDDTRHSLRLDKYGGENLWGYKRVSDNVYENVCYDRSDYTPSIQTYDGDYFYTLEDDAEETVDPLLELDYCQPKNGPSRPGWCLL